ncbi:MAG: hypothetical protein R3D58_14965 [Saprospiraceae bacterium]
MPGNISATNVVLKSHCFNPSASEATSFQIFAATPKPIVPFMQICQIPGAPLYRIKTNQMPFPGRAFKATPENLGCPVFPFFFIRLIFCIPIGQACRFE